MTAIAYATFTPTGSWTSNVTYTGGYSRLGEYMFLNLKIAITGAPAGGGALTINMPTGFSLDFGRILQATSVTRTGMLGGGFVDAAGAYPIAVSQNDASSILVSGLFNNTILGTSYIIRSAISGTQPIVLANTHSVTCWAIVPIIGWNP